MRMRASWRVEAPPHPDPLPRWGEGMEASAWVPREPKQSTGLGPGLPGKPRKEGLFRVRLLIGRGSHVVRFPNRFLQLLVGIAFGLNRLLDGRIEPLLILIVLRRIDLRLQISEQ